MVAMVAAASLAPSVAINVDHAMSAGGQWSLLVLAVMSVLAAPICLGALPSLLAGKRFDLAAGASVVFVVALAFNLSNAVGLAGGARDHQREGREGQMSRISTARNRLSKVETSLAEGRKIAGDDTLDMIEAELMALRADPTFTRSKSCSDVTLDGSRAHCAKIADALRRKGAAERMRQLESERADLASKLDILGAAPSTPDAKVDRLARLTGAGEDLVGITLDINAALLAELLAAFLPAIAFAVFWPAWRHGATVETDKGTELAPGKTADTNEICRHDLPSGPVQGPVVPAISGKSRDGGTPQTGKMEMVKAMSGKAVCGEVPASVSLFADRCLVRRVGSDIRGNDLYAAYVADCRESDVTPVSNKRFGLAVAVLGYKKDKGRVIVYTGIALKGAPRLAVVQA